MEDTLPLLLLLGAGAAGMGCLLVRTLRPAAMTAADDGSRWERAPTLGPGAGEVPLDALYRRPDEHLSCVPKR